MPTILLVEDDELSRDALSRRLHRRGYRVTLAEDGQQGISLARSERPDLILMDLGLPKIDGWQATRILKSDSATKEIPIIVLSAHATTHDVDMAFSAGGDEFDCKPIKFDRLLEKIESLLAKAAVQ